jgi:hypothetical protein
MSVDDWGTEAPHMNPIRPVIRLQVDLPAKQALDALCELRGMTQISVMSRLVNWFVGQDEVVQATILGLLSESAIASLPRTILQRIVDAPEKPTSK